MNEGAPSRTALGAALMRSRHSRLDPAPLFDDPWGDRLVPERVRAALLARALAAVPVEARADATTAPGRAVDDYLRDLAAYGNVILRTRYTEDALAQAVAHGVRQYVLVGAGFDSFALRRPAYARDLAVVEVDHPATQALKRERLAAAGVGDPPATHFVAADLAREDLASVLSRSAFRADVPAFFSWLGVTMYLTRDANLATLRAIAACSAAGSEIVFTYLDQAVFDADAGTAGFDALRRTVAAMDEPFVSGFDPAALRQELRGVGLDLAEDLDGPALLQRYDPAGANGLRSTRASHIARAGKA